MLAAVCLAAFVASALTLVSGFGLGTLLMPVMALFFPVETAVALTAVVHLANNLFKLAFFGKAADRGLALRFGLPALLAAFVGAALLQWLSDLPPLWSYGAFGAERVVTPVKLAAGALMGAFAALEMRPFSARASGPWTLAGAGALSGFFGGLTGHQGALRSAFLVRAGLSKEAFVGTGVVIACMVDAARLGVYGRASFRAAAAEPALLAAAIAAAFLGVRLGGRVLEKITMKQVQRAVAAMLWLIGAGLAAGLI